MTPSKDEMAVSNQMTITIKGDASSLQSALKLSESQLKQFSSSAEDAGNKSTGAFNNIGNALSKVGKAAAAGLAAASTAVISLTKNVVESYADYEQLVGGVETLFKESQDTILEYAEEAYKTAGLSANEYMETVTSFSASLLQSLGGDTEKAAEYSNRAVIDMADNANKMGTSMESIQNAYQGFAKQNYTMLDNLKLGYGGTATEMARLIKDASKLKDTQKELGVTVDATDMSFGNIVNAISVVQKNMGIAGTTAKEASDTISGSLGQVKGAWKNLVTYMGGGTGMAWDDIFPAFIDSIKTFAKNLEPVIHDALFLIGELVKEISPIIIESLPSVVNAVVPPLLEAASSILNSVIGFLPELLITLTNALIELVPTFIENFVTIIPDLFDGLVQIIVGLTSMLPNLIPQITGLIIQLANMLTQPDMLKKILEASVKLLMELVHALPTVLTSLVDALPEVIGNIVAFLTDPGNIQMIIGAAIELFFGLVSAVPQILGSLLGAFGTLVGNLWNGIKSLFGEFAGKFGEFLGGIFKGALNGVLSFIEGFINAPIRLINGFIGVINGAFGWIGVNLGRINTISLPRLEYGGIIPGNSYSGDRQLARVNSGEMVINRQQQAMLWDAISTGNYETSNTVGDIYINVDATGQSNPEGIAVEIAKAMKKAFDNQGIKPNLAYAGSLR